MKNPNGYGSVINLGKKRRKPFGVRITAGYSDEGKQIFKYIGYFQNRREAMQALAEYNLNPYDVNLDNILFGDVIDIIMKEKKKEVGKRTLSAYKLYSKYLKPLHNKKIKELKIIEFQSFISSLVDNLSTGTLKNLKAFIGLVLKKAMQMDVIDKDYSQFIKLPKHKNKVERKIFTEKEISLLWDNLDKLDYVDVILILIYSGMRINELLKLPKKNVNLEENTIIGGSKTTAGKNRIIPIHPKIRPLILKRMENKTEYVIPNISETGCYLYSNFRTHNFVKIIESLGMQHTIHDTRHTFATMISDVSTNENVITEILGHTNIKMTKRYTHTNISKIREEMEKIK